MITITKSWNGADPKLFDGGATFDGKFIVETVEHTLEINYTGSPAVGVGQALFFPIINAETDAFDFYSFTLTRISADEFELTADGDSTILSNPSIHDLQVAVGEFLGVDRSNSGHPEGNHGPVTSKLPTIDAGPPPQIAVDGAHVVSGDVSSFINGELKQFKFTEPVLRAIEQTTDDFTDYWTIMTDFPSAANRDGLLVIFADDRLDYDAFLQGIEDNGGGDRIFKIAENNNPIPAVALEYIILTI